MPSSASALVCNGSWSCMKANPKETSKNAITENKDKLGRTIRRIFVNSLFLFLKNKVAALYSRIESMMVAAN